MVTDELTVLPDQSEILHYDDPSFPLYLRRNALSMYPFKQVLCHWHKEFEFFLVEKGHPSYFVNGSVVPLQEGECLFVNAKYPHYGFSPDGTDSTYLVLVFDPSLLGASAEVSSAFIKPLYSDASLPFLLFPKEKCEGLEKEMKAIFTLLGEKRSGYQLEVLSHLYAFYAVFLSLKGQQKTIAFAPSTKTLLLQRMLAYVYQHYAEKLTVRMIADSAALSPGYASHLFEELLHDSPISYLLAFRLDQSEELLRDFTKDIGEVASEVGFDSPSYFSALFKRRKGLSPRAYRRLLERESE
jgi:AraC-like DNA-binding protein/mannose-6-phosphate isomerase-like protein (cupin superfamily)